MKKIAVLTSGGDSPGMNACIRSVVRTSIANGYDAQGVRRGYQGLIEGDILPLGARAVSGFARMGGTVLKTARSKDFKTPEGFQKAIDLIKAYEFEGIVVIGGDGSLHGAKDLADSGINVIGIPASIDNDIACTEKSIGVDTAEDTILDAIDKIRDTASAHHRGFVIEVMGREHGYLALTSGIAGGAEMIILPNNPIDKDTIIKSVKSCFLRKKPNFICVVAEGASTPEYNITDLVVSFIEEAGFECRKTVLGHVQRGGNPTAEDRILATRFGAEAVKLIIKGESGKMLGISAGQIIATDFDTVFSTEVTLPQSILDIMNDLTI